MEKADCDLDIGGHQPVPQDQPLKQLSEVVYPSGEYQQQYLIYLRYIVLLLVKSRVIGRKCTGVLTRTSELAGRQLIVGFIEAMS